MANILFIGDPHLKIARFDLAKQFLAWVNTIIVDTRPDIVVNLGDTFDTHAVVRSEIMQEFRNHVDLTLSLGIKYFYVLGNHDMYKPNDSKYHALQSFKGTHKNLVIVDSRIDYDDITFVPYFPDHRKFPKDTKSICVAHQTFVGADYGYIRPEVGVLAEDVAAEVIISGHIHIKQEFGKVTYPGSPYSQNASDVDQIKGVILFDTATYAKKFFQCPLPMWRRLNYILGPSFTTENVHEDLVNSVNSTDHWIIGLTGPKSEINSYINSKKYNLLKKTADLSIKSDFTDKEKRLVKIEAMSMEKIMQDYIDNVYSGSFDKELLKNKTLEIIEEANKQ